MQTYELPYALVMRLYEQSLAAEALTKIDRVTAAQCGMADGATVESKILSPLRDIVKQIDES